MSEKPKKLPVIGDPRNAMCSWCGAWRYYCEGYFVCPYCDFREIKPCE